MYTPYQKIAEQLHLKSDDTLLVASDITKLAYATFTNGEKFDIALFVDSFKSQLATGTLLFPAFNDDLKNGEVFNIKETSPTTGTLSTFVFSRPDFIRTHDPLHSFMVWGKHTDELKAISNSNTFGADSVFGFLHRTKAKMLFINVDLQHSFTFAHYVEEQKQVSYRKYKKIQVNFVDEQGRSLKKEISVYSKKLGVTNTLNVLQQKFIEQGAMSVQDINGSTFMLLKLDEAYAIIEDEINSNNGKNLFAFSWQQFFRSFLKQFVN